MSRGWNIGWAVFNYAAIVQSVVMKSYTFLPLHLACAAYFTYRIFRED